MTDFATLDRRRQVARLRTAALKAVSSFPIDFAQLRLVNHGFNTTFKVVTHAGTTYALRLGSSTLRTSGQLGAELAWLSALSQETDVSVPTPVADKSGQIVQLVEVAGLAQPISAVLFQWLDGAILGEQQSASRVRQLGRVMATLHMHGKRFTSPSLDSLSKLDDYLWMLPDRLEKAESLCGEKGMETLLQARSVSESVVKGLWSSQPLQIIHADLHGWNLLKLQGKVGVIDFDDCGLGLPIQDLAVASYYQDEPWEYLANLVAGYEPLGVAPKLEPSVMNAQWVQRNLLLLNDLLDTKSAEFREMLPTFTARTVKKLSAYLDSGEFRHQSAED